MTEQIKYTSMGFSLDDVLNDYKIVENSICDEKTFQEADSGLVLSVLSDAINYLEKYKQMKSAWEEVLQELEKERDFFTSIRGEYGRGVVFANSRAIDIIKQKLAEIEEAG